MLPYALLLTIPGFLALTGIRRSAVILLLVALLYWLMIGFRFQVGMDWDNYVKIYQTTTRLPLSQIVVGNEPGFKLLMWLADRTGGGILLVNAVSALVFCWGFFTLARRCREPLIAIVVATPLLVVGFAMSGTRQALALGLIFYLCATWNRRRAVGRMAWVLFAGLFHFSAIFFLIFVALAARTTMTLRVVAAAVIALVIVLIVYLAPEAMEAYSQLYVSGGRRLEAPGAIAHVGILATASLAYFLYRKHWIQVNGDDPLYRNLAIAALVAVPGIYVSSVGAYRFSLYLWPMAMYVWAGMPALIQNPVGRMFYRLCIVIASGAVLIGWLSLSNSGWAWLPYQSWLVRDEGPILRR